MELENQEPKDAGAECYRRYIQGDDSAFNDLVDMYAHGLILFINRLVRNLADAEDLMEDTFCELILHKKHFRAASGFKTYLYSIGRNKAVSYIRKNAKIIENAVPEPVDSVDLADLIARRDRDRQLYNALSRLREEYRETLHLFYFEEMDYQQISAVLKKNKGQIKNLLYRGRQALKELLQREGFEY